MKNKNSNNALPFTWGGTTPEWQQEAKDITFELKPKETKEEIKKDIEYGNQKQRW
ncbi:hypothetical protein IZY60_00385 [Lutibacter sp. B2]|nr:hypothetical protein [Lutibacter sp. B2]